MSGHTKKLAILRARTDHDLLILVTRELDRSLALANVATTTRSPLYGQAEKAFTTAKELLPRVAGLSPEDRLRIEEALKEVRSRLDRVPAFARAVCYPASFAS